MSPPHLGVREDDECQSSVTVQFPASSAESALHHYMGSSDCSSSVGSSAISIAFEESRSSLNLGETELRLGLPGSQSPTRDAELGKLSSLTLDENLLFPLYPVSDGTTSSSQKIMVCGNKRGFSDGVSGFSKGKLLSTSDVNVVSSPAPFSNLNVKSGLFKENSTILTSKMEAASTLAVKERILNASNSSAKHKGAANHDSTPAPKAQVVGWPPIRSFRKNALVTTSKNTGEVDGKSGNGVLFVKVSMDGAPYLRKVDIKAYTTYLELSSALQKMFTCFIIGHCTSQLTIAREMLSENKLKDLVHDSEYVLTYEDRDGDWMLVGDIPWEMFIDTCRRLRIMKSSDTIGLAPRAVEICRNRS